MVRRWHFCDNLLSEIHDFLLISLSGFCQNLKNLKFSVSAAPEVGLLHTGGNFSVLAGAGSERAWNVHYFGILENSKKNLISLDLFFQ